ncbi:Conserved_hypothetical protein [Hexamita inflata]|uniref:Ankyrin repeat-containing protein n=1 Tax=Hexamita inflata TaxID=28002 RepID=A0ABP1HYN2_9EUKA
MPSIFQIVMQNNPSMLLKYESQFSQTDTHKNTPLMLAAKLGYLECCRVLKSLMHKKNTSEMNAFFVAIAHNQLECAQFLEEEADFEAFTVQKYQNLPVGCDLLTAGIESKNPRVYQYLVSLYRKTQCVDEQDPILLLKLSSFPQFIQLLKSVKISQFKSQLAQTQNQQVPKSSSFNVKKIDQMRRNIAHYMALLNFTDISAVQLTKELGVDFTLQDANLDTPLKLAIMKNQNDFIRVFCQLFAVKDSEAVKQAVVFENRAAVRAMVPLHLKENEAVPVIFYSIIQRDVEIFKYILEFQADCKLDQQQYLDLSSNAELAAKIGKQQQILLKKDTTVFEFINICGDKEKAEVYNQYMKNKMNEEIGDALHPISKITNINDQDTQRQIFHEVVDVINLMKLNHEKQRQEFDIKMDCIIQFYEKKTHLLEQALYETEQERNELLDVVADVIGEDKAQEIRNKSFNRSQMRSQSINNSFNMQPTNDSLIISPPPIAITKKDKLIPPVMPVSDMQLKDFNKGINAEIDWNGLSIE